MSYEKQYRNNFLSNVICRIDFNTIPALEDINHQPDEFMEKINDQLPSYVRKILKEFKTSIKEDNTTKQKIDEQHDFPIFSFNDKKNEKNITLVKDHLIVQFYKYKHFSELISLFKTAFDSVCEIYYQPKITRVGLRYINEIKIEKLGNPLELEGYIADSLTYTLKNFIDDKINIARNMNQIILKYEEFQMNFVYGIHNTLFPNPITNKEFILDYDCFSNFIEGEDILGVLDKFHEKINELFEKSIGDSLRDLMEVINE